MVQWENKGGKIPDRFVYLCFPIDGRTELMTTDLHPTGQFLSRALMCSEKELHIGNVVSVWNGSDEFRVWTRSLTMNPNVINRDSMVDEWKRAVEASGQYSDWSTVGAKFGRDSEGNWSVFVSRKTRKGLFEQFQYLYGGDVQAQKWLVNRASQMVN